MKVGLLIAIERELKAFLESGEAIREENCCGRKVYRAQMGENEVIALCSGWGEIDAAAGTQLLIACYGCQQVWNFGVTGALDPALKVEDLFVVQGACHYDYDVSLIDAVKPHQYSEFPDEFIPLDRGLIEKAKEAAPELRETRVASGDRFVEDRAFKRELFEKGCQICDMEIAAIARVCFLNQVPCLSIKCISDTYEGDGGDFQTNVERSAAAAFRTLRKLLEA
ncbi:MAG: 5'-methylthioadenosine/S-adenosylhomocysteine nucleosidase [Clostridia bacterium]|nr:5'-methylthioadenosine/S-adenosylhomocysteine nucleosidase [Clostridia bacterium]